MGFGVAVSVPDGVAIATDSRVIAAVGGGPPSVMSDTQQKIVPVSHHVAVLTIDPYHMSEDVSVNIRAVLEQITPDLPRDATLEQVLAELPGRFLSAAGHTPEELTGISLRVVGYSEEERAVKVALVDAIGSEDPKPLHSTNNPGVDWFGFIEIASRLVKGTSAIEGDGFEAGPAVELFIPTALMSLDDALQLAETFVQTSATFASVVQGFVLEGSAIQPFTIPVGGPVQSAVVRSDGIHWTKRPRWAIGLGEPNPS